MGLLDFLKKPHTPIQTRSGNVGYFSTGGHDSWVIQAGYKRMDQNADVQMCVNKIADIISSMPIALMANDTYGDIQIKNGLSRVVDIVPNKHQTRKTFMQTIIREALLKGGGNSIVLPHFEWSEGKMFLSDLEVLDMNKVSFYQTPDSYQIQYQGTVYSPEQLLHFVFNPSRLNHLIGEGYAPIIREVLENIAQGNATKNAFFKQPKPSLVIGIDSDSEVLQEEEGIKNVQESYTRTMENGKPWILPSDGIALHQIKPESLKDLAINESLDVERKTIAAAFGLPPFMVGVGEFNREHFNNFISTTIRDHAQVIEQEFTKKLLYSESMYFKMKNRSLLQYDLSQLTDHITTLMDRGVLNKNEGRNEFDYTPVDLPEMNDYTVLENYIKVQDTANQAKLNQANSEGGE